MTSGALVCIKFGHGNFQRTRKIRQFPHGIFVASQNRMIMAAIVLLGAGILVELCSVLLAPHGYQDDRGFHPLADSPDDEVRSRGQNPG
jgi:hypothetical protein